MLGMLLEPAEVDPPEEAHNPELHCKLTLSTLEVEGIIANGCLPLLRRLEDARVNLSNWTGSHVPLQSPPDRSLDDDLLFHVGEVEGLPFSFLTDLTPAELCLVICWFIAESSAAVMGIQNAAWAIDTTTAEEVQEQMKQEGNHTISIDAFFLVHFAQWLAPPHCQGASWQTHLWGHHQA